MWLNVVLALLMAKASLQHTERPEGDAYLAIIHKLTAGTHCFITSSHRMRSLFGGTNVAHLDFIPDCFCPGS